jgi:colanic acid biosynthesis glycosyl transferase WcaI
MRILLLNQFVPPDSAPTSRLLADLADGIAAAGWEPVLLGAHSGYHKGGQRGLRRLFRDGLAHLKLFWAGLCAGPCDWVICLSDPPALPFTSALLARCKRARLAHWAMDVYPQVAEALGALSPGLVSHGVGKAMRFGYREADLLVALDADMRQQIESAGGRSVKILPPWPPPIMPHADEASKRPPSSQRTWLYSGNLGRAHEYRDLLEAQQLIERSGGGWRLVFQGGGPCRAEAKAYAAELGLTACEWLDYAPEEALLPSLQQAEVLIATQRPCTRGLLWPSKLALMTLLDQPVLFVGPTVGPIADLLTQGTATNGVFPPGRAGEIADWLRCQPMPSDPLDPPKVSQRVAACRAAGLEAWTRWLT